MPPPLLPRLFAALPPAPLPGQENPSIRRPAKVKAPPPAKPHSKPYSMFSSLATPARPGAPVREPVYTPFGVRKRQLFEAAAEGAAREILDICDYLQTEPYWQGRLQRGIPCADLNRKDSDAAHEWEVRCNAVSAFLMVFSSEPPKNPQVLSRLSERPQSQKKTGRTLSEEQQAALQALENDLKRGIITNGLIDRLRDAIRDMEVFIGASDPAPGAGLPVGRVIRDCDSYFL